MVESDGARIRGQCEWLGFEPRITDLVKPCGAAAALGTPTAEVTLDLGMKATILQPSPPSGHLHYALKTKINEKFRALDNKKFKHFAKLGLLLHVKNVF